MFEALSALSGAAVVYLVLFFMLNGLLLVSSMDPNTGAQNRLFALVYMPASTLISFIVLLHGSWTIWGAVALIHLPVARITMPLWATAKTRADAQESPAMLQMFVSVVFSASLFALFQWLR